MDGARPAAEKKGATTIPARHRRLASPMTAPILGALGLALVVADLPLDYLTHSVRALSYVGGSLLVLALGLGVVLARRQPANPIGWIFAGVVAGLAFYDDAGR